MPPVSPGGFALARSLTAQKLAYVRVRLIGPGGSSTTAVTLMDTGASYSAFDRAFATQAGYVVHALPTVSVTLASGKTTRFPFIRDAQLEVEGTVITARQVLLLAPGTTPLLSPGDMLFRSEFAFDSSDFYFD